jgi:hypothetical protein
MHPASLFDSFNARSLDPAQVGRGFIYTPIFRDVAARRNTAIIGPRGSGKTTFLKMLTLPALNSWRGSESARITRELDFVAIYVPSDFTWYPDFRRAIQGSPDPKTDELLSYALFRHHVLLSICDTLQHLTDPEIAANKKLCHLSIPSDETKAGALTRHLSEGWDVPLRVSGYFGLRRAVTEEIKKVQYYITLASLEPVSASTLLQECPSLGANIFDDLKRFADEFEAEFQRPSRWAACFDELEIAPKAVKSQVWQSGRSFDSRFLIKISASPFDKDIERIYGPRMPMQSHDFHHVVMADQPRAEVEKFSKRIFSAICYDLETRPEDMERLLGNSVFDETPDGDEDAKALPGSSVVEPYAVDGHRYRILRELASKDTSFASYLMRRGIDLDNLQSLSESSRAAEIRKISSTVAVRNEFLRATDRASGRHSGRRLRTRKKVPDIYTGARSLLTLCDGNPRWLVGLLRPLLKELRDDYSVQKNPSVSRRRQAERIERSIATFLSLLATIPLSSTKRKISVVNLIEEIGVYFHEQILREEFNPEPVLSFTVNEGTDPDMEHALGLAINQGAFVLSGEKGNASRPGSIEDRRIRLTYLLAPRYKLPLVRGRAVQLSHILRDAKMLDDEGVVQDLFGESK